MPELPEVEVVCRGLAPHLVGRTVRRVWASGHRLRLPVPRKALRDWVEGAGVLGLRRRAKYILVEMSSGATMVLHLGMSGRLGVFAPELEKARHDHLAWLLDNESEIRFNDTRRFGSVQVFAPNDPGLAAFLEKLGVEPLSAEFSAASLFEKSRGRSQPVKNFLMDSSVVVGIGNIYASEILFEAGVRPTVEARAVSRARWQRIAGAGCDVLERAIEAGGSTIADFVSASGESGYFQLQLAVYGRAGEPCKKCGRAVEKEVMAGRATYFCRRCQR